MTEARIVVAGAGPVGLAFACACPREISVVVLEAAAAVPQPEEAFDVRILALSGGTRQFLRDIGVWERMDAARTTAVRRMEVHGDAAARLAFSGRPGTALAWIVEANRLGAALQEQADSLENVRVLRGVEAVDFEADANGVRISVARSDPIEGHLLVGADGPDSRVRARLGLVAEERAYGETAVVANFECDEEHGNIARQWLGAQGVLAWLPLPGRRISIVWSVAAERAAELQRLEGDELARRVSGAGGGALGGLRQISPVAAFPLRLILVERTVAPGVALVGDAAHGVHPLAGQGVNLGFQDARVLAGELAHRSPLERPGDLRVLRRYARARREDVSAMQFVTDGLDRLFGSDASGVSWLRNAGLRLVDGAPWAKGALAERAMR